MIKIAFWYDRPLEYAGGINYFYNLLYALSLVSSETLKIYVFFPAGVDQKVIDRFSNVATVIETRMLRKKSVLWLLNIFVSRVLNSSFLIDRLLNMHGITVISHAAKLYGLKSNLKRIYWIPDFQFLHYPDFFPKGFRDEEVKRLKQQVLFSDAVIVSSFDSLKDYESIFDESDKSKARVLQFVSQVPKIIDSNEQSFNIYFEENSLNKKFLYLPNQFWKHKNHIVVLRALAYLKKENIKPFLICSGRLSDFRDSNDKYFRSLVDYIEQNDLSSQIKILGSVDYSDVLQFMEKSVAVLNPSKFEGWSSTVEEAKTLGKKILLSDIDVHIEQSPKHAVYFPVDDHVFLAKEIRRLWTADQDQDQYDENETYERSVLFGERYLEHIRGLF